MQQRASEIVERFRIIRVQPERFLILANCGFGLPLLKLKNAEIIVGHPAVWILCNRRAPERFCVTISRGLRPGQKTESGQNNYSRDHTQRARDAIPQLHQTCGRQSDRANAREILVMISHEGVAESVKHEEPEQRRECCHKEERAVQVRIEPPTGLHVDHREIPIVEHMRGLSAVPERGGRFTAAPVKVKAFGTFPVRAFVSVEG